MIRVRIVPTEALQPREVAALRSLMDGAFDDPSEPFTDDDWEHAIGGLHFIAEEGGEALAHASVVERELHAGDRALRTGYVEAVATSPGRRRSGLGTAVMRATGEHIDENFQLGALGTGVLDFYERLGWRRWMGPTYVRSESGLLRTAEDDGYVLVRITPTTPELDLSGAISCDWRPGDVW